jgi:hypothetical protein
VGACRRLAPSTPSVPGIRIEVEVVQPDGGRTLVVGKLDAVPEVAGGKALQIRVGDAQVQALAGEPQP